MRKLRANAFSMVFQDPMSSLNPTIPIGKQMVEAIKKHHKISTDEGKKACKKKLMRMVEIDDVEERFHLQPHFFRRYAAAVRFSYGIGVRTKK